MKNNNSLQKIATLLVISIFLFASCKKSGSDKDTEIDKEAKISIRIENTGDIKFYNGSLGATSSLTKNLGKVSLSGIAWSEENTSGNVTVYHKDYDSFPDVISFETVGTGTYLNFFYTALVIEDETKIVNPMKVLIKYYLDGKLVKTEHFSPKGNQDPNLISYSGKIEVKDY